MTARQSGERSLSPKRTFGDYQTPAVLADAVCRYLQSAGVRPARVIEPTCGLGRFLHAAADRFGPVRLTGFDVNQEHLEKGAASLEARGVRADLAAVDFFTQDWNDIVRSGPKPVLLLGNPPWVTNADLRGGANLPRKSNFHGRRGVDAVTGASNFDICEYMLLRLLAAADGTDATLAFLCKTSVARNVLRFAWEGEAGLDSCTLHRIDAHRHFDASVDAALLTIRLRPGGECRSADLHERLGDVRPSRRIGWADGRLIADAHAHARIRHLTHGDVPWRSGVKHDAAAVMELTSGPGGWTNGAGWTGELEEACLFPLMKSSDVAAGRPPRKRLLVTQRRPGEDPAYLKNAAPNAWKYLLDHADRLDRRRSRIYRGRPRFCLFGVGGYTFAPWKVAVSGLYKSLQFRVVGPIDGRPVVFDDTVYFLPCRGESDARAAAAALASPAGADFLRAFVFPDAKRPVTVTLLRTFDLNQLGVPLLRHTSGRATSGASDAPTLF